MTDAEIISAAEARAALDVRRGIEQLRVELSKMPRYYDRRDGALVERPEWQVAVSTIRRLDPSFRPSP